MGPIEDGITPPADNAPLPVVGYWHGRAVYCVTCAPVGHLRAASAWLPIRDTGMVVRSLICVSCGAVVVAGKQTA